MEAHRVLKYTHPLLIHSQRLNGYAVESYGTGSAVRLPGPTPEKQNIFPFGTPYHQMQETLALLDPVLYSQNGLLAMLERNKSIKLAPEKFQETKQIFKLLITCEERCYDAVVEELINRPSICHDPVHIINVEIRDTNEDAILGAKHILELVNRIHALASIDEELQTCVDTFVTDSNCNIRYCVAFF